MKEKKKTAPEKQAGAGGGGIFDGPPIPAVTETVSISSGPYAEELPVGGMTVGGIRQKFSDRLDIAKQAQAILNGNPVADDIVVKAGEALMFIQHAGEKGASVVTLTASTASVAGIEKQMEIPDLLSRCGPNISTGNVVLPYGIKAVLSSGPITVWVWERPPCIQKLSWIASDSAKPYGPGTKYRDVRIALPYLIIFAVFQRDKDGLPTLIKTDECFFRNAPMNNLDDSLMFPALLNCSKFRIQDMNPLSWICTQYLKSTQDMDSDDVNLRFRAGFEAVRYCLLETSFNLSSEHHEGNSWYGHSKKIIPRIETVEKWEEETNKDPLFVLDTPWVQTGHTVRQVADRIFQRCGSNKGGVKNSDDIARIIINA